MSEANTAATPDLTKGIASSAVPDGGMLLGHVADEEVLLARAGDEWFAIGAYCTHYHGRLADGLLVDDTIRCPLHHACFSLRTGEALRAPALDPVARWRVDRQGEMVVVRDKLPPMPPRASSGAGTMEGPASIVIVGGGAAGLAAADMLRREGYRGPVTIISADQDPPVDRPNLSKDYLAGEAEDSWIPLWPADAYAEHNIDLIVNRRVTSIDPVSHSVQLEDGSHRDFGALLLATGADPVRLPIRAQTAPTCFTCVRMPTAEPSLSGRKPRNMS